MQIYIYIYIVYYFTTPYASKGFLKENENHVQKHKPHLCAKFIIIIIK